MIFITKAEAEIIREKFPNEPIPKTCYQKNKGSRGKRYVAEKANILKLLYSIRGGQIKDLK